MSTVQNSFLKFILRADPIAKGTSTTVAGRKFKGATNDSVAISSSTPATPIAITTASAHGLVTGDHVSIIGHLVNTSANNTATNPYWVITKTAATTFTIADSAGTSVASNGTGGATGTVTYCLVGSEDSTRLTRQRLLDVYNEARFALFNALYETKSPTELTKYVYGTVATASAAITYSSPYKSIPKPSGLIRKISIFDAAATPVEVHVLPNELLADVKRGLVPSVTVTATNLLAFDIGQNWSIVGNFGTTPAAITYYGITSWTWVTDVLPNTTVETFSPDVEPILIELACAIADEQSNADVLALAKTLLNKRN